ncbi:hypothetical protein FHX76_001105 [Lysinibacter cavernae]|uniref:Uncharacterized protein n=1 Tax=Lysinibacter cavernae TaxID=1640652 RepID=A0A7X5R0K1_9MICO|nr:hypothetical protein [Lysinibacter cavernae]
MLLAELGKFLLLRSHAFGEQGGEQRGRGGGRSRFFAELYPLTAELRPHSLRSYARTPCGATPALLAELRSLPRSFARTLQSFARSSRSHARHAHAPATLTRPQSPAPAITPTRNHPYRRSVFLILPLAVRGISATT